MPKKETRIANSDLSLALQYTSYKGTSSDERVDILNLGHLFPC